MVALWAQSKRAPWFHVFLERWNDEVLGEFYICDTRRADLGSACVPTLLYGGGARRPLNGLLLQRGGEKNSPRGFKPSVIIINLSLGWSMPPTLLLTPCRIKDLAATSQTGFLQAARSTDGRDWGAYSRSNGRRNWLHRGIRWRILVRHPRESLSHWVIILKPVAWEVAHYSVVVGDIDSMYQCISINTRKHLWDGFPSSAWLWRICSALEILINYRKRKMEKWRNGEMEEWRDGKKEDEKMKPQMSRTLSRSKLTSLWRSRSLSWNQLCAPLKFWKEKQGTFFFPVPGGNLSSTLWGTWELVQLDSERACIIASFAGIRIT